MLPHDPAADELDGTKLYECPVCGHRTEAQGSCCCSGCGTRMRNISKPRDR